MTIKAIKAFIASEFGNYPLVWMLHSRKLNSRVNKLHERALRILYQDYASSFTELLEKVNNSTTIYDKDIQLLATELLKVKSELSDILWTESLWKMHSFIMKQKKTEFKKNNVKLVYKGIETWTVLRRRILEIVLD